MNARSSLAALVLPAALALSCGPDGDQCPAIYGSNITNYKVRGETETAGGVKIDVSGQDIDLAAVDCIVDALEACYAAKPAGSQAHLDGLPRGCLQIKVAQDWYWNECRDGHQIFPCDLSYYETCRNRVPDPANGVCACACAGVIQDGNVAVVTPDLAALSHELTHVVFGVYDPIPDEFKPCADGIRTNNCAGFMASTGVTQSPLTSSEFFPAPTGTETEGCTTLLPPR
jgi:hypothetical protein